MQDDGYMETIEMLAATIAHEVKNPLSLIQANVDFIELCDKEKKHSENYRVIREELRRTNEMLNGFIELITVAYTFDEEVAIYDVIMNVVENYRRAEGNTVAFSITCPDKNLLVKGNFQLLGLALSNVVKNAVEAIGGGGSVGVSTAEERGSVIITVKDTGRGIPPDTLTQLSEGKIHTTKEHGSGIGVNICKKIVEEHGGSFDIKNAGSAEKGCVVTITIPSGSGHPPVFPRETGNSLS